MVAISIVCELLTMWAKDNRVLERGLTSCRLLVKVVWLCCLALLYWQGFADDQKLAAAGQRIYLWLSLPWVIWYGAFAVLQVTPTFSTWLRTTENRCIRQLAVFLDPMDSLYVGKNLHESESNAFAYQVFWFLLLSWKLYFSFKFEIQPLVQPSAVLYHDHLTNEVSLGVTIILIFIRWWPFVMIYFIDLFVWHAIWVACTGASVGLSLRIGEVRTFEHIRQRFMKLPNAFNSKLLSEGMLALSRLHPSLTHTPLSPPSLLRRLEGLTKPALLNTASLRGSLRHWCYRPFESHTPIPSSRCPRPQHALAATGGREQHDLQTDQPRGAGGDQAEEVEDVRRDLERSHRRDESVRFREQYRGQTLTV
jgi:hypothetical protein